MRSRVSISIELYDERAIADTTSGQTLRWSRTLLDDETPSTSAQSLAYALREAQTELPATVARLRGGDIPS